MIKRIFTKIYIVVFDVSERLSSASLRNVKDQAFASIYGRNINDEVS